MGESVVESQNKIQMGESVSFGKYENDALCWEKWSTFSPNKYLEEVGRCSTPGSVAEKKAFFEAHYKKIAAMKVEAELLEATETESQPSRSNFEQVKEEECINEEEAAVEGCGDDQSCCIQQVTSVIDESESMQINTNADKLEEAVLVNNESMKLVKRHFKMDEQSISTPKPQKKANQAEKNVVGMKKKAASVKAETSSSTRPSKPKATPAATSSSSASKSNNPSVSEKRRASLHLSMSMSSVNSDTPSSVASSRRPSLFMEQMGDKDIVKRAFKTFQNRLNQLPSSSSSFHGTPKQGSQQKASASTTMKENERSRKAAEKMNPSTWKSVSSGSLGRVDGRAPSSSLVVLTSNERRKEFFKNSTAREAERAHLTSKSKEAKDAEMKKFRQNLSFKAKPMPSFYRVSKTTSEKKVIKNGTQRQSDSGNMSRC